MIPAIRDAKMLLAKLDYDLTAELKKFESLLAEKDEEIKRLKEQLNKAENENKEN